MRRTALLLTASLALALLAGCADGTPSAEPAPDATSAAPVASPSTSGTTVVTVEEGEGDDAQAASVAAGDLVQVDLATCGGCGFGWRIDAAPDPDVATREETPADATDPPTASASSGPPLPGSPTTTTYVFRAGAAGKTTIGFGYYPPTGAAAERTAVLTLEVTGASTALPETESAKALVEDLYVRQASGSLLQEATREELSTSLAPDLADLLDIARLEAGDEVGRLDFDPLYEGQDAEISGLQVQEATLDGRTAVVRVAFTSLGEKRALTYRLQPIAQDWRVSDITYTDGRTLAEVLRG